jgi:8-oxo-dGTP pyrophosphatase MutT (NUDIX family)
MGEKERFLTSVSVGLILEVRGERLLLVHNRDPETKEALGWGLIAGGVELESPAEAILREALEEAGIRPRNIIFSLNRRDSRPDVICMPGIRKPRLGLVYRAKYSGPRLPSEGWRIQGDRKVDWARPFLPMEVAGLVDGTGSKYRGIYRRKLMSHSWWIGWLKDGENQRNLPNGWMVRLAGYRD